MIKEEGKENHGKKKMRHLQITGPMVGPKTFEIYCNNNYNNKYSNNDSKNSDNNNKSYFGDALQLMMSQVRAGSCNE